MNRVTASHETWRRRCAALILFQRLPCEVIVGGQQTRLIAELEHTTSYGEIAAGHAVLRQDPAEVAQR
jgi:hypothetical protein